MSEPLFSSDLPLRDERPEYDGNIDLLNDETFGSGAVDDDWEGEHNHFAEQHSRNSSVGGVGRPLDEEELELSNQKLAAAVEELVLNSDQDQDAIDPAIVSLRKESRRSYHDPGLSGILISPYMGEKAGLGQSPSPYSSQNSSSSSVFQTDGMRNIWSNTDSDTNDSIGKLPSMILERRLLNEKLKNMVKNSEQPREFEDTAILTAVKAIPTSAGNWPPMNHSEEMLRQMFPNKPTMLRAEDLEKEFSKSDLRSPSPTFGISIPRDGEPNHHSHDRSLPARSVSPVIGSPTSHVLPIGTPPKHVTDMLHQAHKQGVGVVQHPLTHPTVPVQLQRPPRGFMMNPPGKMGPPGLWPPGMLNRPPMNPLLAQDLMNKIGLNKPLPVVVGSPPINMSPMGSPRLVQAPHHMIQQPMAGFGPRVIRAGPVPVGFRGPMPSMRQFPNQRFAGFPRPPMYLGPGHLHPEHSRFVRMRLQQQMGRNHLYNGNHHHHQRMYNRDGSLRDPHSNLMTSRDKEWVVKIQMLALQSDRPEIDDYYYQHYIEKRLHEGKLSLDDENSERKRLITPTKTNLEHKKYVPVQFDNSLGKLTASSVYNPRQIIDVIHAEKEDGGVSMDAVDAKMSMNKRLEIYSVIEKAYPLLMELEEIHFHAEGNENENDTRYSRLKRIKEFLFPNDSAEVISQILRIRKGKRLLCRALPHLTQEYALSIILTLSKQLPALMKRDQKEDILQEFYIPVCRVIKHLASNHLLEVCTAILPSLNAICRDKFGFSMMCKLLVMVEENEGAGKFPDEEGKIWERYVRGCFRALLATFGGKKKASLPTLLENKLGTEAMAVLENHSELVSEDDAKQADRLKEIRDLLSQRNNLETVVS